MDSSNWQSPITLYEPSPYFGGVSFPHDKYVKQRVCIDDECGWVEDATEESIWTRLLGLLMLNRT